MRLSKVIGSLLVSAALCASPAWAQPINDQVRSAARTLADEGFTLYDQGKYSDALDRFERADALVNAPTVKLLAARTLEKLGRLVEASERYRAITILQLDDKAPDAFHDAQATAAKELSALTPRIPTIELVVEGPGAEAATVMLDGKIFPRALMGVKAPLNPGVHRVEAETPSSKATLDLNIVEKEAARAVLALKPKAASETGGGIVTPPVGETPKKPPGSTQRLLSYIAFGVGGGFTLVGIGTAIGGVIVYQNMEGYCEGRRSGGLTPCANIQTGANAGEPDPDSPTRYKTYRSDVNTLATLSTVGFVLGGVGLAAGAVLFFTAPKASKTPSPAKATVEPWIGLGSAGLHGTF